MVVLQKTNASTIFLYQSSYKICPELNKMVVIGPNNSRTGGNLSERGYSFTSVPQHVGMRMQNVTFDGAKLEVFPCFQSFSSDQISVLEMIETVHPYIFSSDSGAQNAELIAIVITKHWYSSVKTCVRQTLSINSAVCSCCNSALLRHKNSRG